MRIFVGLDCGGTTSRVLAVDEAGEAVFRGQSGGANLLATPPDVLLRNVRKASQGCPPATFVCGAFAGLVGQPERERALRLLEGIFPGASVRAEPDYAAAHAAAPAGTPITVVAGTGSLVCGRDAKDALVKTGGWGYLLGDSGSGYRFGRAALVHFLRHPSACSSSLLNAVESAFGTQDVPTITASVYAAPSPQPLLARLLPAFAADLRAGEPYAEAVVAREEDGLAEWVAQHVHAYLDDPPRIHLALAGGVWKADEGFGAAFRRSLERQLPERELVIERIVRPPVEGAVALAKEQMVGNGK